MRGIVRRRDQPHARIARYLLLAAVPLLIFISGATPLSRPHRSPANPEQRLRIAASAALRANVDRKKMAVYPSPAYDTPYLRDSFWALQALGNRRISIHALATFLSRERPDGQPASWIYSGGPHYEYQDDDSAALLLIWAWRNTTLYGATPAHSVLLRTLRYMIGHDHGGYYVTPPGRYRSWWDAYAFPTADAISYNQGLYAVALRCARRLGLPVPERTIKRAAAAYRALFNPHLGYMQLSRHVAASDASALTGEFLSLWLFKRPMLSDRMVLSTMRHLTPFGAGFRITHLPPRDPHGDGAGNFPTTSHLGAPGDYQNGASWLLYDALTIAAAGFHGYRDALPRLRARLALEFYHGVVLHEYLRTTPALQWYIAEPPYRDQCSWDAFVVVIVKLLHGI